MLSKSRREMIGECTAPPSPLISGATRKTWTLCPSLKESEVCFYRGRVPLLARRTRGSGWQPR
jgi:hypothetical protein